MSASELFMDIVTDDHGSPCIDCQFCNRTHFAHNCDDADLLREKAKKEPEKYIEDTRNDSLAWGCVDGKRYVWRCPCDAMARYEDFIWRHRELIAKYLKKRAAANADAANRDNALIEGLK